MLKKPKIRLGTFFEYETQKIVQISSVKIGLTYRCMQFGILAYIIGFVLIYQKGYQDVDSIISSSTSKVKGVGFINVSDRNNPLNGVYDVADFVVPPLEHNAFFVMTHNVITVGQQQTACPEDPGVFRAKCKTDHDCVRGGRDVLGNGIYTGKCVESRKKGVKTCEIYAWCPTEDDKNVPIVPTFPMAMEYTILIKNDIEFPKFKVKRRNILPWSTKKFLYNCFYNKSHPEMRYCPIVKIATVIEEAGMNQSIFIKGGVIGINIDWTCNLDWKEEFCNPAYTFVRLDDEKSNLGKGLNFRYAQYYYVNGTKTRDLIKAYGIRFVISVTGKAGKFAVLPLSMNLGSGLALLGLASVLCDMFVLKIHGDKQLFNNAKYEPVVSSKPNPKHHVHDKNKDETVALDEEERHASDSPHVRNPSPMTDF